MSLFAIGDTHLSFGVEKPMDVFHGWSGYEQRLEENWRKIVKEDDTVLICGDVSWGMKLPEALEDFRFLHSLPGKKILMKGNHDYWWETKAKMQRFLADNGIDSIDFLFNNAFRFGDICIAGTKGWFYENGAEDEEKALRREAGRLRRSLSVAKYFGCEPIA
ncbi:MAG: metallophosphoesterase, partial [Clostridia bacterium]|nr:metallophosphoesterase [Clostridia bacterium]